MEDNKINSRNLKEAIVKTIVFFSLFDYPLTLNEIWQNLNIKCKFFEVMEELEKLGTSPLVPFLEKERMIESKNGFYFLAGQEKNIRVRLDRYNFTDRKFKRAMLISKIFKFIPWIKMMAVSNLLGAHNLKNSSDIDFFIVAEDKRIWLVRFFCAGIAKLLGLRPKPGKARDKICLSFYISGRAMDLSGLMLEKINPSRPPLLKGAEIEDIYFTYWLAGLTPFYNFAGAYQKFIKANSWLYDRLPNWQPVNMAARRQVKPLAWEFYHDIMDLFFGGLEPQFKKLQLNLMPLNLKNLMNQGGRVVINDQIIKLHANDRREEYRARFSELIIKIIG